MSLFFNKNAVVSYNDEITQIRYFQKNKIKLMGVGKLVSIKDIKPVEITDKFINYHGLAGIIDSETIFNQMEYSISIRNLKFIRVNYIHEIQNIFTAIFKEKLHIAWCNVDKWM